MLQWEICDETFSFHTYLQPNEVALENKRVNSYLNPKN